MRPCLTQFIIIKKAGVLKTPAFFISNREIKEQEVVCLTEERKRKFLQQYRLLDQDIRRKKAECDIWKDRIQYLSWTQDSGTIQGTATETMNRIRSLEEELNQETEKLVLLREEIRSKIHSVKDDTLRLLLEYHYIDGLTLEKISGKMNYSYVHVCRLHKQALSKMML